MTADQERWVEIEEYAIRVSSLGVMASAATGRILTPYRRKSGTVVYNLKGPAGRRTATIEWLMERAGFWSPADRIQPVYTAGEDSIIRQSRSIHDAAKRLPGRSIQSIKSRKRELGVKWVRAGRFNRVETPAAVWGADLYARIRAAAPRGFAPDVRDDLIQDVAVMLLEGFDGQMGEAFRQAMRARNRAVGAYKEVSAFGTIGRSSVRLIDTFAAGASL